MRRKVSGEDGVSTGGEERLRDEGVPRLPVSL